MSFAVCQIEYWWLNWYKCKLSHVKYIMPNTVPKTVTNEIASIRKEVVDIRRDLRDILAQMKRRRK